MTGVLQEIDGDMIDTQSSEGGLVAKLDHSD